MRKYSLICFDMDGVLVDSMPRLTDIAVESMLHGYPDLSEADARALYTSTIGLSFPDQLEHLFPGCPRNQGVLAEFHAAHCRLAPEFTVTETARKLHREVCGPYLVALATSTPEGILQRMPNVLSLGWDCLSGYRVGFEKPIQISVACQQLRVPYARTLYVGDTKSDAEYASQLGVAFQEVTVHNLMEKVLCALG